MESTDTCEPCKARGNITSASKYCFTCQESHCLKCAEVHKSSKATRTHLLVHINDIQLSVKLSNELKAKQTCGHHAGKYLEYFCVDHKAFLCRTCLLMKRHCSRIIHMSAPYSPDLERKMFSDKIYDELDQTILKAKYAKEKIRDAVERSKSVAQEISDKFDAIRDRFLTHFEEQKSYILNHAKKKITRQTDLCMQMVDGVDELITEAEGTETFLKEIKNVEQNCDIVHWIKLSIDKMKELEKRTEEICEENYIIQAEFENTSLAESIEKKEPFIKCSIKETKLKISNISVKTTNKEEFYDFLCSRDILSEKGKCDAERNIKQVKTSLVNNPTKEETKLDNKEASIVTSLEKGNADIAIPVNTETCL
ncbi:E3 ubiquitin-protein ligase TRIM71-like [Ruditapes philippinarum]|uniref:E3 ubiquitin-protein ligase TRIM71-like n=1 Tax=Ruditapes philippinarum TaxID=129788 RepID=UPI00295B829E|nr:E3 ubiquitin-protein ligase TRIM71-like [Ruditapes philippinarum]